MRATVNGVELAYNRQGTGTPVLLLHAFPLHRIMWASQMTHLSPYADVIALDLRGHGESGPISRSHTLDDLADDVAALLDHLAISKVVLAGLSMGGYIALSFARRYAARLQGLILADTRAQADTEDGRAGRFALIKTAETKGVGAVVEAMLPKLLSVEARQKRPDLVTQVSQWIRQNPIPTITADLRAMAERPDSTPILPKITVPTLVIVGEQDGTTPPADARLMADRIPAADLAVIPAAGHLSNVEQPERFNAAVLAFLDELRETT